MDFATMQAARDKLFDDAFHGRLTWEQAEAEATRQGLEPLRRQPDISQFDPMAESTWTLAMAVAWIVWRTPEAVRENWNAYLSECWHWIWGQHRLPVNGGAEWEVVEGWELKQRDSATLLGLSLQEALDEASDDGAQKLVSVKTAREELWKRLAEGALTAAAIAEASEHPVQVPTHEWPYLEPTADRNFRDGLRFDASPSSYRDVTFKRADVCGLWKASDAQARQTIAGEHGCQNWLESEMRQSPDSRPKTKASYLTEALSEFSISKRGFERAWSGAVQATGAIAWSQAGAPRKSPH